MGTAFENGSPVSVENFDYDEIDRGNPLAAELCEASPKVSNRQAYIFNRDTVLIIRSAYNSKLSAEGFLLATSDLSWESKRSMRERAKALGVTVSALSKECLAWCYRLKIDPGKFSPFLKDNEARQVYREGNWRPRKKIIMEY